MRAVGVDLSGAARCSKRDRRGYRLTRHIGEGTACLHCQTDRRSARLALLKGRKHMKSHSLMRKGLVVPIVVASVLALGAVVPAEASAAPTCLGAHLSGKTTGGGAGMSQPYSIITVTNTGAKPCTLKGYPILTGAWSPKGPIDISVKNGSLYNQPSAKVTSFVLAPRAKAWFALGSADAYTGPMVTFIRITFAAQKGTSVADSSVLRQNFQANGPVGKPIPLGVTAWAPGKGPAQQ